MKYVPTRDIQSALKGREPEVLAALGIDWQRGKPHIPCPLPNHADGKPSWRFDPKKGRAFCSCFKGSDSVFDIVTKVRGIDFEAAKLFVAECLGRADLIRDKAAPSDGRRFPASDPASLLTPPADARDDGLIAAYLGFRLGIDAAAVPLPSTPYAGWRAYPYFDPPASKRKDAKPVHVGDFPCAVFGQAGPDGKRHAHRIYLAEGGAGKADPGIGPNGYPRDPKKSARTAEGELTAGRCVLWGNPATAPWLIAAEGIETAAAIAYAYADRIAAGEIAVAAAVSTAGLAALRPWAGTKRITVAADRDEAAKPDGKPGSRAGEKAARALGMALHSRLPVAIALPGAAGSGCDFLDLLRQDGPEAVRRAIDNAAAFRPSRAELDEQTRARGRKAALEETARTYPLPPLDMLKLDYRHTEAGQVKAHKLVPDRDSDSGRTILTPVPIATPFGVVARLRLADRADEYGLRIVVQDMNGQARSVDIDRADLPKRGAPEVMTALYRAGLRVEGDGEAIVLQCLKAADPEAEIVVLRQPGWHELPGQPAPFFLTPAGETIAGSTGAGCLELHAGKRIPPDIATSGTLDGWKTAIAAAIEAEGCPHWTLGAAAAFAGPLLALAGLDTVGINLSGLSSSGKSTAQRIAVSAWSSPDVRHPGLFHSARSTDNAMEGLAEGACGTVLVLDELAHIPGKDVSRMIYTLAGGVGKERMNADTSLRTRRTWATFAMLSAESSLAEKVTGDGASWSAGMAARLADIDVTGIDRRVGADRLATIDAIHRHYGHAGPAFIRALIARDMHNQPTGLREEILDAARTLAGDGADSARQRAALPFALLQLAGEWAIEFGLLPAQCRIGQAVEWAWDKYLESPDATALNPQEQTVHLLREFIARNWNSSIKPVDADSGYNSREADGWYDDETVYLPQAGFRKAIGGQLKEREAAKIVKEAGLLTRHDAEHCTIRNIPKIRTRGYALSRKQFGREPVLAHTTEPRFAYPD